MFDYSEPAAAVRIGWHVGVYRTVSTPAQKKVPLNASPQTRAAKETARSQIRDVNNTWRLTCKSEGDKQKDRDRVFAYPSVMQLGTLCSTLVHQLLLPRALGK